MATKTTKAAAKPKKKKGLTAKQEVERERLETLIGRNEERLSKGVAANGVELNQKQIETTRQIIKTQREKLQELDAILEA
jgi:hypothetical protein